MIEEGDSELSRFPPNSEPFVVLAPGAFPSDDSLEGAKQIVGLAA